MFCTNCGAQLPDGSKFCPNCGTAIHTPVAAAVESVKEEAQEKLHDLYENVQQKADTVLENYQEDVQELKEQAAELYEEKAEQIEETVDSVKQVLAGEPEAPVQPEAATEPETAVQAAVTESVPEQVTEAAEAVAEAAEQVSETADAPVLSAEPVEKAAEPAVEPVAEEAAQAVPEADVQAFPQAPADAPAVPVLELPVEIPAEPAAEPAAPQFPVMPEGSIPQGAAQQPAGNPYTGATAPQVPAQQKTEKKKSKLPLVAIIAVVAIVAGFLIYQNLPSTKFKKYVAKGDELYAQNEYVSAAENYYKALQIDPDDSTLWQQIDNMYDATEDLIIEQCTQGLYADALNSCRDLAAIDPAGSDNEYAYAYTYDSWISDLILKGDVAGAEEVLELSYDNVTNAEYLNTLENKVTNAKRVKSLGDEMGSHAAAIAQADADGDIAKVFDFLASNATTLIDYYQLSGNFYCSDLGNGRGVLWLYNPTRNAAELYVGGIKDGMSRDGEGHSYYITNLNLKAYEYFEATWANDQPNGPFMEASFHDEPGEVTTSNSYIVSGNVVNGYYDGEITNQRGQYTYIMKFSMGKVQVLDTVDPNGETNNVVGYTADKNNWLIFSDSGLDGNYGVRYVYGLR